MQSHRFGEPVTGGLLTLERSNVKPLTTRNLNLKLTAMAEQASRQRRNQRVLRHLQMPHAYTVLSKLITNKLITNNR
jgi:hypothetical protein